MNDAVRQPSDDAPSVLWLCRELPWPLDSGDRVYTARLAEHLAAAGARVTVMGLAGRNNAAERLSNDSKVAWRPIDAGPRSKLAALPNRLPVVAARFSPIAYIRAVREELSRGIYRVLVLDQYALGWVLLRCHDLLRRAPLLVIHVSHDFETEVTAAIADDFRGNPVRKLLLRQNARKTKRCEALLTRRSDLITVNTQEDAAKFAAAGARSTPVVLRPGYAGQRLSERSITAETPRRVALLGSFVWTAKQMNLAAFLEAADGMLYRAGVAIDVIGAVPASFKAAWGPRLRATVFHGFVKDLPVQLARARVGVVAESTGGGFKHKTLDYLYARVPIAAYEGALAGIPDRIRRHFLLRPDAPALARQIAELIDDLDELNRMQEAAYAAAADEFRWDRIGRELHAAILARLRTEVDAAG